mgnify:CR=1 FL=1
MSSSLTDYKILFQSIPGNYLILKTDAPRFTIVDASDAYFEATKTTHDIIGKGLFEVFPDNPNDPNATGVKNITLSLNKVIKSKAANKMADLKYDIPLEGGGFQEKYWSPQNSPVLDEHGEIQYIINSVMDITNLIQIQNELKEKNKVLERINEKMLGNEMKIGELTDQIRQLKETIQFGKPVSA